MHNYWLQELKGESMNYKSLQYVNLDACVVGKVHPVWDMIDPQMVEQASVQAKLLVQRYALYGLSCSGKKKSDKCPLCKGGKETLEHFILHCPRLSEMRQPYVTKILNAIRNTSSFDMTDERLMKVILDPSVLNFTYFQQKKLSILSRKLCFVLHNERNNVLGGKSAFTLTRNRILSGIMY